KLGRGIADTISRVKEIKGEILTIFGTLDPHVPLEGRQKIIQALAAADIKHKSLIYEANHTFMRDDGYRYDPVATDNAWTEIIKFYQAVF
ncbi:MAG: dienelactone hydrolase family protein, partial [Cyanobacteria bacterium P01_A01_bin.40]